MSEFDYQMPKYNALSIFRCSDIQQIKKMDYRANMIHLLNLYPLPEFDAETADIHKQQCEYIEKEYLKIDDGFLELMDWKPESDIDFFDLYETCKSTMEPMSCKNTTLFSEHFSIFAEVLFSQISDTMWRKDAITMFLSRVYYFKSFNNTRERLKSNRSTGYNKNWHDNIKSNKLAAQQVLKSLLSDTSDEQTETLKTLLSKYSEQCDYLMDGEFIQYPWMFPHDSHNKEYKKNYTLKIKEYRLPPARSKKPLKEFLEMIIHDTNINVTKLQIKQLLENINIQSEI